MVSNGKGLVDDRNLYGRTIDPKGRGKHETFSSAIGAAFAGLLVEKNEFFDSICDRWRTLFPSLPMRPGRYENGIIFLYVRTAPLLFAMRPKLRSIAKTLADLPGAPAKVNLRLEIHAS